MAYQVGILEACQDYGLVVGRTLILHAGWSTRGGFTFTPKGAVNHHTAGAPIGLLPSLWTLLNGRPDDGLPGPLCNAALDRWPRIHLIAAGKANHAGKGSWQGISGNSNVWGLEVEHTGSPAEPVMDNQWDLMYRWHAACADFSGFDVSRVCQHFEWAPARKIDFVESITNPHSFRRNVGIVLRNKGGNDVGTVEGYTAKGAEATGLHVAKALEDAIDRDGNASDNLQLAVTDAIQKGLRVPKAGDDKRIYGALRDEFTDLLNEVLDARGVGTNPTT